MVFPLIITTINGHSAVVTNPELDHYLFEVTIPQNYPSFEWYEEAYHHPNGVRVADRIIDEGGVQGEILNAFWQLQRGA